jgi:hypothetical protein
MQGWIKMHRQVVTNWVYDDKPFSRFHAWTDLLLSASHEDKKFVFGNELIEIERGSFISSELKLADRWGWSKTKVRNFLELLEKDKMIIKKSDRKKTTINICNYCIYQDSETIKEPLKNHQSTTEKPLKNTIKNYKNEKKKDIVSPQFDEFWSLYPRKVEKQKALAAWEGVIKRGSDPSEVIQATNNYIQQIKVNETETKFIKHPSSFFNKDTWKDYLSTSISPSQQNIPDNKEKITKFNRRMEIERNEWFASGKSETEWETYYREEERRELGSGANRTRSDPIKA